MTQLEGLARGKPGRNLPEGGEGQISALTRPCACPEPHAATAGPQSRSRSWVLWVAQNDSADRRRRADSGRQNPKITPGFPALSSGAEKG